jgi:hypothetical protein
MTPTIVMWSSTSAPRYGCASSIGPRSRSTRRLDASCVPTMLARSRCWSASARSPTDYSFQQVPGSMTFFTWGCSSLTAESR